MFIYLVFDFHLAVIVLMHLDVLMKTCFTDSGSRCSIVAAVCLGLLCVLLLSAVIVLLCKLTAERDGLSKRFSHMGMLLLTSLIT